MKHLPTIAGAILGLAFVAFSVPVLFNLLPPQAPPPEGSAVAAFFMAFGPTGYLTFVKVCELIGGIFTAIPRTRILGLMILTPIVVNILAFHVFVAKDGILSPILIGILVFLAYLFFAERRALWHLVARERGMTGR